MKFENLLPALMVASPFGVAVYRHGFTSAALGQGGAWLFIGAACLVGVFVLGALLFNVRWLFGGRRG